MSNCQKELAKNTTEKIQPHSIFSTFRYIPEMAGFDGRKTEKNGGRTQSTSNKTYKK